MRDHRHLPVLAVAALAAVALMLGRGADGGPAPIPQAQVDGASHRLSAQEARAANVRALPPPAPLRFAPAVAASDRQVVLDAVAALRPEARALVELVAGLVTVQVAPLGAGHAGVAAALGDGYAVMLDLGGVYRQHGMRGVRRLVAHELAHVVDGALVQSDLERRLDAATPRGYGCARGSGGACASRAERFAESFAKWATGDIGDALYLGYRVPPPSPLAGWGAPLAGLAR